MKRHSKLSIVACVLAVAVAGTASVVQAEDLSADEGYDLDARTKIVRDKQEDPAVGLKFLARFDKRFEPKFLGPGEVTFYESEADAPRITDPDATRRTITFIIHEGSDCIRCIHGGQVWEICRP